MEEQVTNQEIFNNAVVKNIQNGGDNILIAANGTRAKCCESEWSKIENGEVILNRNGEVTEWEVSNYEIKRCPQPLQVCIKNLNVLHCCAGNPDNDNSYFVFKTSKDIEPQNIELFGAIEIAECAIVFYYDCGLKKSCYVTQPRYGKGSSDIFELVKQLRKMEGRVYGHKECCKQGLEDATPPLRFPWEDNLW